MEDRAKRQRPPRLLIVEDDESQLRTLTAIMQEEGYDVTGCSTASEATEHIKNLDTGVVVLDLHLPDLSGTQLLERLASHNSIRVIIHTAYSSYETARDSLNLGAFANFEKGGNPQELLRHVHRAFAASLRSYADKLETAVAERTHDLLRANESLKKEITERKKAESRLSGALAWREAIFEGSLDAVLISDANSKFITVNNRACELTGYSKQELLGMRIPDLHEEQDLIAYNLYHDRIMSGEDIVSEAMLLRKDGTKIETEFSNRCIRISGEVYMHTVARDITERKKVEDKLRKYQAKLKAMASEILRTEQRERKRIAIELHDNICQNLVLTKVLLQSTLRLVSDPSVSGPLKMASGAMSELIEKANSLTFQLSNPVLQELGLVLALKKHLTEEVQKKHGIAFELEGDEQLSLQDEEIKNSLFRISRELLLNIVKHAQAHNVKVSICKRRSQIRIVIQDDGVGFDSNDVSSKVLRTRRFGLFSIREQLEHLGGDFAIESEPGRGTAATVVVPLGENILG